MADTSRAVNTTPHVVLCASHFEKMLCDNALLSRVYLHAYQASGDPFFRRIVDETKEIVIIGDPQEAATQALFETVHGRYLPNRVLVVARPDQVATLSDRVPLRAGRTQIDGAANTYACDENFVCQLPVTEPEPLLRLLEAAERRCSQ